MRIKIIIGFFFLIFIAISFIPVSQQKELTINATFFNIYQRLANGKYWIEWNKDLENLPSIITNNMPDGFNITNKQVRYQVKNQGYNFLVSKFYENTHIEYGFVIVPQKFTDSTEIITSEKTTILGSIINKFKEKSEPFEHIKEFKLYMETPSLYYGFNIVKKRVTDTNIIVLKKLVLTKDKFTEAKKSFEKLKLYLVKNHLKQTQPLMAQYIAKANDSIEVNIGIPIDKVAKSTNEIHFLRMPNTGSLYILNFSGKFKDRIKAYSSVKNYFDDKHLTMPILPFEIYLNNKLPTSENDTINIELRCSTY